MHVWLVNEGEALPSDISKDRLRRMGLLAEQLVTSNHKVTWFNSSFYHARKVQRCKRDTAIQISPSYDIRLIWSNSYKRNISLGRIVHHVYTAHRFKKLALKVEQPDIIVCSIPTIELAEAVVEYGTKNKIPVVVDIRDLWPDIYQEMLPTSLRFLIKPYILHSQKKLKKVLSNAYAITALTNSFLEWGMSYSSRDSTNVDRVFNMAYKKEIAKEILNSNERDYWNLNEEDFLVCFFGTIGKQFDFEPIICAANLFENDQRINFVICGDGESLDSLKSKTSNLKNILFPGWVNQEKIQSLLQISSIGLAPYRDSINFTSNIPNKFGEYLSAGMPILLGIDGEMGDLVRQYSCGYVYKNGEQLAEFILKLKSDAHLRENMSKKGIELFEEKFNAENVYFDMVKYLQEVSEKSTYKI